MSQKQPICCGSGKGDTAVRNRKLPAQLLCGFAIVDEMTATDAQDWSCSRFDCRNVNLSIYVPRPFKRVSDSGRKIPKRSYDACSNEACAYDANQEPVKGFKHGGARSKSTAMLVRRSSMS
jgi:hypothetical protein